jgi:hypothetical protein
MATTVLWKMIRIDEDIPFREVTIGIKGDIKSSI